MVVDGVHVLADASIPDNEIEAYVAMEKADWKASGKELGRMKISLCGDDVEIESTEKSPIIRLRRITGYLSNFDNFNHSKKVECQDRVSHMKVVSDH